MRRPALRFVARLAGAAAASGLALAGLVVVAAPASAAACSGSTGVTVVVDTGSSISTRCAGGTPDSAWDALTSAGFTVTRVDTFPGAICKIDGFPQTACLRMPPGNAYWAFFHAKRGGSWVYSSSGAKSYDPAPGSVVGFRFGSGQQPGIAPPAATRTSTPTPTKTAPKPRPKPTTAAPRPTTPKATTPKATSGTSPSAQAGSTTSAPPAKGQSTGTPSATSSASATASASPSPTASATDTSEATPSETASDLAAAPTSTGADDGGGPGTLIAGAALVALVAGGAGWAAYKRRT